MSSERRTMGVNASKDAGSFGSTLDVSSPPGPTTVRTWPNRFEACDGDPGLLIDGYGRNGDRGARLRPEAATLMGEWVEKYQSNLKPTMSSLYRDMRSDFRAELPGLSVPTGRLRLGRSA